MEEISTTKFDTEQAKKQVEEQFEKSLIPGLCEFIKIPNLSPQYDSQYLTNGLVNKAANHIMGWCKNLGLQGLTIDYFENEGKTPLIYLEVAATNKEDKETLLFYGHFDKQPHMEGKWREGLGATKPVIIDEMLYGRGGADDGYSIFAVCTAIKMVQDQKLPHSRCIFIMESAEESGSIDMNYYLDILKDRIGNHVKIIFVVDSGAGNYDTLWITSSLRGCTQINLEIEVTSQGIHSGDGSGNIPECFRIARILLNRIEDCETGKMHDAFQVIIPPDKYEQSLEVAKILDIKDTFPFLEGVSTVKNDDPVKNFLARIWEPTCTVIGVNGLPSIEKAGNVVHPKLLLRLSIRTPPTLDAQKATQFAVKELARDPPYNAKVKATCQRAGQGWNSMKMKKSFQTMLEDCSQNFFGQKTMFMGEGVSIPLVTHLQDIYSASQILVIGVLGPDHNAHGPNEMFHIPYAKKLVCCMSQIIVDSCGQKD